MRFYHYILYCHLSDIIDLSDSAHTALPSTLSGFFWWWDNVFWKSCMLLHVSVVHFLLVRSIILVCIYGYIQTIHLPIVGYLGCNQFLVTRNKSLEHFCWSLSVDISFHFRKLISSLHYLKMSFPYVTALLPSCLKKTKQKEPHLISIYQFRI